IFALRNRPTDNLGKPGDGWLQRLVARTGTPLINWPTHEGPGRLSIGTDAVPVDIAVYTPGEETVDSDGQGHAGRITPLLLPIRPDPGDRGDTASRHLPRSIVPSHTTNDPTPYHAKEVAPIGSPITVPSPPPSADPDATALGTAVHAVFAASPIHRLPEKTADILRRWDIGGKTAHAIAEPIAHAVEALETFLRARYTVTTIHREVPVALRYDNGQEMHGWIDLVVHTPDGWVIVDHKTHRSADPASVAVSFGPQLAHYRRAVEQATGEPVVETLINFVLLGVVYRVGEDRST
ncbi:MAG TPA: PD-(D/E)XK nuclease family protein, partial [Alkalispirochaeta sp.]|nr:PD-(D/E)XK nuclease family protein [Alkalispirochaeta sp.]